MILKTKGTHQSIEQIFTHYALVLFHLPDESRQDIRAFDLGQEVDCLDASVAGEYSIEVVLRGGGGVGDLEREVVGQSKQEVAFI
jgi:hypothetical protein